MRRTLNLRPYTLIIMLFILLFFISNYFVIRSLETHFLELLEEQYINYASIYSHGLTKTAEAHLAINDMLERRLYSALQTIALYSEMLNNEILAELVETLVIDQIYLYDPTGKIEYSNNEAYLGWLATPGHPVYQFMISDLTYYIEEIRQDTESDEFYKYGYFRLDDGRFIQVGVDATSLESILDSFEVKQIIYELSRFDIVDHVYFINPDGTFDACCDANIYELQLDNPAALTSMESMNTYSLRRSVKEENKGFYEIFIPILVSEDYAGTLVVIKSTDEADALVRNIIILSYIISGLMFLSMIYIMISSYRNNKKLIALGFYDSVTKLPNSTHFIRILDDKLEQMAEQQHAIAVIHFHNLNTINSTYGPNIGEKAIKILANKIESYSSGENQLFRLDANRFILLIADQQHKNQLISLAEHIIEELESSIDIVGRPIEIRIGLVKLDQALNSQDVIKQIAMTTNHLERQQDNSKYAFFDAEIEEKVRREEIIAKEMSEFLTKPDSLTFYLEYQPKVDLASNQIVGFEALSRMNSPTLGRVSPLEFIPIAEREEMIIPLGYWVLETACQFIKKIGQQGYHQLYVGVNISVIQLLQDDFPNKVVEIVNKTGINPEKLQLEITESVLINDFDDIQAKLQLLRDLGLTIALDDFGTGYSALSRMGELAVDSIKLDKSFIDKILIESNQKQIIQELIALCHKLDLNVVAEGVEQEEQRDYLLKVGCDIMQGYLYSKPLEEELAFRKLVENN